MINYYKKVEKNHCLHFFSFTTYLHNAQVFDKSCMAWFYVVFQKREKHFSKRFGLQVHGEKRTLLR